MPARAKMKCEHKIDYGTSVSVKLTPVTTGSQENEEFYKYTPGGAVDLTVMNPGAAEQFIPGKEYYVDFTPAE